MNVCVCFEVLCAHASTVQLDFHVTHSDKKPFLGPFESVTDGALQKEAEFILVHSESQQQTAAVLYTEGCSEEHCCEL